MVEPAIFICRITELAKSSLGLMSHRITPTENLNTAVQGFMI